jgi:hypothetical protein
MRQHTSACVVNAALTRTLARARILRVIFRVYISISQHTSPYVTIRHHTSPYVTIRTIRHTSEYFAGNILDILLYIYYCAKILYRLHYILLSHTHSLQTLHMRVTYADADVCWKNTLQTTLYTITHTYLLKYVR